MKPRCLITILVDIAFDGRLCLGFTNSKRTIKRGIRNIWNEMKKTPDLCLKKRIDEFKKTQEKFTNSLVLARSDL